jgi:hypothetical protein
LLHQPTILLCCVVANNGQVCDQAQRHLHSRLLHPLPPPSLHPPIPVRPDLYFALPASQVLHFCAVVAPNQDFGFMLIILWSCVNFFLSNFFINYNTLSIPWLAYLKYLSPMSYGLEALVQVGAMPPPCRTCQPG